MGSTTELWLNEQDRCDECKTLVRADDLRFSVFDTEDDRYVCGDCRWVFWRLPVSMGI